MWISMNRSFAHEFKILAIPLPAWWLHVFLWFFLATASLLRCLSCLPFHPLSPFCNPQCTTVRLPGSGSTVNSLILSSWTFYWNSLWLELPKGGVRTEVDSFLIVPGRSLGLWAFLLLRFLLLSFWFPFVSSFALCCSLLGHSPLMLTRNTFTFSFTMSFHIPPGKSHPYSYVSRRCLQSQVREFGVASLLFQGGLRHSRI